MTPAAVDSETSEQPTVPASASTAAAAEASVLLKDTAAVVCLYVYIHQIFAEHNSCVIQKKNPNLLYWLVQQQQQQQQ